MLRTFLLVALLTAAFAATAETLVTLERDGRPVATGEVCRFQARDREDPLRRWLPSQTVTCVAAGSSTTFPSGLWNVFGRIEGKAVSNPVLVDGSKAPEKLSLPLSPGASLIPTLPAGRTAVFYSPRRAVALPFLATMQRVTVPASEALWAIVLEKAQPVGIVFIPALDAGSEQTVDLQGSSTGGPFVLGWLQVAEEDRVALSKAQGMSTPRIHVTVLGSSRESDPLPPLALLNGAFVLVRGVNAGDAELDLAGRGWIPYRSRVRIATQLVTVASRPLVARGSASIFVSWSTREDLPALDQGLGSCGGDSRPGLVELSVATCTRVYGSGREKEGEETCAVVRQERFPPELKFGTFTVDDLTPGKYRVELNFGKLPPTRESVELHSLQQQRVDLLAEYVEIYGGLTLGGELLDDGAKLKFPMGGTGFASRETGEYHAVLLDTFDTDARIDVTSCRGGFHAFALASRGCTANARFDIDIPDNELVINVFDTFTRAALEGAAIKYAIISLARPPRPVVTGELKSGRDPMVMKYVPERELRIAVSRSGYQKQEIKPFTMPRSGTKTLDVELVPLRGSSGRILSPRPFDKAWIYWFSVTGTETEHLELDAEGTFTYQGTHGPDETMVVVSLSHPLWVSRAPTMQPRAPFTVRFPETPIRTFDVQIPETDAQVLTYIGLVVGGLRVPHPALRMHQELRELPFLVRGSGPLRIRDLAESGPIELILGPKQNEVPVRMRADPMTLPQFATNARTRLPPGVTSIVLEH